MELYKHYTICSYLGPLVLRNIKAEYIFEPEEKQQKLKA
jgi:hypothetical protein